MPHIVRFLRSRTEPDECRAVCSCGWSINGTLNYTQERAATHDRDEIREPPLRQEGFISGLPDKSYP